MNLVARSCTRLFHCHNQNIRTIRTAAPAHSRPAPRKLARPPPRRTQRCDSRRSLPARLLLGSLSLLREDCAGIFQCATAGRTEGGAVQVAAARDRVVVRPPRGGAVGRAVALRVLRVLHASHRQREELRVAHRHPNADVLSTQFASVNIQSLNARTLNVA